VVAGGPSRSASSGISRNDFLSNLTEKCRRIANGEIPKGGVTPYQRWLCKRGVGAAKAVAELAVDVQVTIQAIELAAKQRRLPDYAVLEGAACGFSSPLAKNGCGQVDLILTRFGHIFGTVAFGASVGPGANLAVRAGWLTNVATTTGNNTNDSNAIDGFLLGFSSSAGVTALVPVEGVNIGPSISAVKSGTGFNLKTSIEVGIAVAPGAPPSVGASAMQGYAGVSHQRCNSLVRLGGCHLAGREKLWMS
jgi:hypothetical protein